MAKIRLYWGNYGHRLSGKQYVYWGPDNYQVGQQVVAPVTNPKSGRTYNTMFTIAMTRAEDSKRTENEVNRLATRPDGAVDIKYLEGTNVLSLPSGSLYESKAQWARASERKYQARVNLRVNYGVNISRTANPATFLRRFR